MSNTPIDFYLDLSNSVNMHSVSNHLNNYNNTPNLFPPAFSRSIPQQTANGTPPAAYPLDPLRFYKMAAEHTQRQLQFQEPAKDFRSTITLSQYWEIEAQFFYSKVNSNDGAALVKHAQRFWSDTISQARRYPRRSAKGSHMLRLQANSGQC